MDLETANKEIMDYDRKMRMINNELKRMRKIKQELERERDAKKAFLAHWALEEILQYDPSFSHEIAKEYLSK